MPNIKNMPAFPRAQFNPQGVGYEDAGIGCEAQDGMTLRDYFATHAMQMMISDGSPNPAKRAWAMADEMLATR